MEADINGNIRQPYVGVTIGKKQRSPQEALHFQGSRELILKKTNILQPNNNKYEGVCLTSREKKDHI